MGVQKKISKIEVHQSEWKQRSKKLFKNNILAEMKESELYDLTWKITTDFIIKSLKLNNNHKIFEAGFGWGRIIHGIKHY